MPSRLAVFVASIAVFAGTLAIDACSSDEAPADAPDASDATTRDVVVVLPDAEETCDPNADLFAKVNDASIADGASSTGICGACMRVRCSAEIASCTADCPCQAIVGDALECYLTTQQLGCLGRLTNYLVRQETRARALALSGCARSLCPTECAIDGGAPPPDASTDADSGGD